VNSKDNFQTKTYMNDNMSKYLYHSGIFLTILLLLLLLLLLFYLFGTNQKKKKKKNPLQNKENKVKQTKNLLLLFIIILFSFLFGNNKNKDFLKDTVVFKLECTHWMHFLIKIQCLLHIDAHVNQCGICILV
jgi:di/tricarboxylate transporter